jgi:hypothetical protein
MKKRAGKTLSLSISVDQKTFAALKKRAVRLHDGNVSAVIAEIGEHVARQEALGDFLEWAGLSPPSPEAAEAIEREWRAEAPAKKKRRRAA